MNAASVGSPLANAPAFFSTKNVTPWGGLVKADVGNLSTPGLMSFSTRKSTLVKGLRAAGNVFSVYCNDMERAFMGNPSTWRWTSYLQGSREVKFLLSPRSSRNNTARPRLTGPLPEATSPWCAEARQMSVLSHVLEEVLSSQSPWRGATGLRSGWEGLMWVQVEAHGKARLHGDSGAQVVRWCLQTPNHWMVTLHGVALICVLIKSFLFFSSSSTSFR